MLARQITIITFSLVIATASFAQGFLHADGKQIVNGQGKEVILRGIGLGGWMLQEPYMLQLAGAAGTQHEIKNKIQGLIGQEKTKSFYTAWLANHCTKADIDSLAAWGFNSVRLPMHYNLFTLPIEQEPVAGQNTWLDKGFALTDSLLRWCSVNRIYLILDLHASPGAEGTDAAIADYDTTKPSLWQSEANRQKMTALWIKLAQRYVNEPWIGGYDVLNEPNWGFENAKDQHGCAETANAPLRQLYVDVTNAIRSVDKNHLIIMEGNCWGNNYKGIFPFDMSNTAVSFHKYWNYNNLQSIQGMLDTRDKYNMPIWVGETGENSNVWATDAIQLLEAHHIGWAWWPLKKLGFNCPFEVTKNEGYQNIVNYWRGKGPKPSEQEAFNSLMQLAENLKVQHTTYHKDFIDAMFRQVRTVKTIPFGKNTVTPGSVIFATDYDLGRNGYAYFDNDTANFRSSTNTNIQWNRGHAYRNDGADIDSCTDKPTNKYSVGYIEAGEWLQYTLNVPKPGKYNVELRASATDSTGVINIMVDGAVAAQQVSLPVTANKQKWQTTTVKGISLKGKSVMRIYVVKGGFNLNYIKFSKQ